MSDDIDEFKPIILRLRADLRSAAKDLKHEEARYLVDLYYQLQDFRKATGNQTRTEQPNRLHTFFFDAFNTLERTIPAAMDIYTDQFEVTQWAKSMYGIGPVITAGLYAHIDLTKAQTAGAVWRFAGLDPTQKWLPKTKRPWNARLKVLCWKIGQSFNKFQNRDDCVYGKLLAKRKLQEVAFNEAMKFADQAKISLEGKVWKDKETKAIYEAGKLPAGRLQLRAERYAVKLFLAHYWQVGREILKLPVPRPYILEHGEHAHFIAPPNWPMVSK